MFSFPCLKLYLSPNALYQLHVLLHAVFSGSLPCTHRSLNLLVNLYELSLICCTPSFNWPICFRALSKKKKKKGHRPDFSEAPPPHFIVSIYHTWYSLVPSLGLLLTCPAGLGVPCIKGPNVSCRFIVLSPQKVLEATAGPLLQGRTEAS